MKIRLDLDDELVQRTRALTREDDTALAILKAIEEYVRRATYEGISSLAGKIEFDQEWLEQRRSEHPERRV